MKNHIAQLGLSSKQLLKEWVTSGMQDNELVLNVMAFLYDENRGVIIVEGLMEGDEIDGLEYAVQDFQAMVNEVLADVPIYQNEEEEAAALRTYLTNLSLADQQQLKRQLSKLTIDEEIVLEKIEFLYDDRTDSVVINVREQQKWIDQLGLSRVDFLAVVREVVGDAEMAG